MTNEHNLDPHTYPRMTQSKLTNSGNILSTKNHLFFHPFPFPSYLEAILWWVDINIIIDLLKSDSAFTRIINWCRAQATTPSKILSSSAPTPPASYSSLKRPKNDALTSIHRIIGSWKERGPTWNNRPTGLNKWSRSLCLPRRRVRGWRWYSTTHTLWTIMMVSPSLVCRPRSHTSKYSSTDQNPPLQCSSKRRASCMHRSSYARKYPQKDTSRWSAMVWMDRLGSSLGTRLW